MKLTFVDNSTTVGEVSEAKTAGFDGKQFAKMQVLVTKNLVADKYKYCIQEVISNAVDSYLGSGRTFLEYPIEVSFTGGIFTVRDYGKGISVEKMEKVVMPLFASDKTHNNENVGGLTCKY